MKVGRGTWHRSARSLGWELKISESPRFSGSGALCSPDPDILDRDLSQFDVLDRAAHPASPEKSSKVPQKPRETPEILVPRKSSSHVLYEGRH